MTQTPLVQALQVGHLFAGPHPIRILEKIDLTLYPGESVAITGVSGSGKSTLLQILGLLTRPSEGTLLHQGRALTPRQQPLWRNQQLGFVFQHCHLLEELTPLENVMMPAAIARWPEGKEATRQRAAWLLELVGLAHRLSHPCRLLSGGEKQRVAIARALMNRPSLLLADEPSGNLDAKTGRAIQDLLLSQVSEATALCVVTHDLEFAARCDRSFKLVEGRLAPTSCLTASS